MFLNFIFLMHFKHSLRTLKVYAYDYLYVFLTSVYV